MLNDRFKYYKFVNLLTNDAYCKWLWDKFNLFNFRLFANVFCDIFYILLLFNKSVYNFENAGNESHELILLYDKLSVFRSLKHYIPIIFSSLFLLKLRFSSLFRCDIFYIFSIWLFAKFNTVKLLHV